MAPSPSGPDLAAVAAVLAEAAGLSFAGPLGPTLQDGLRAAAAEAGAPVEALVAAVAFRDPAAVALLLEHVRVGETWFWRLGEGLEAVARRAAVAPRPLSLWSAGCATGEEAYSLAMALLEAAPDRTSPLVATDLSARALEAAREGCYGPRALRRLTPERVARWFGPPEPGARRRVATSLAHRVRFEQQNLVTDPPPAGGPFDVILARNVVIYFEPAVAERALRRLADALAPRGALLLGPVELPLAQGLPLEPVEEGGVTLLVKDG
ncbi:MAG: CheR family methyltransferase [Anaeromyxobacter sp.]